MTTKFKVGDKVIADGEKAVITQIISAPDSDWDKTAVNPQLCCELAYE